MTFFACLHEDTYDGQHLKDATISWYFITPSGNEVLPDHLFKDVKREDNVIIMNGLRDDVEFSALADGDSVVEGRCVAFVPLTNKKYPSEPFLTIGARGETPQVIEKPKIEGILKPMFY